MMRERRVEIIGGLVMVAVLLGLAAVFFDQRLADSFITYRYARNFASGAGLVYNPGQPPVLSEIVSPLYAIILAAFVPFSLDLPTVSTVIGILGIALGALALYAILRPDGALPALAAAGIYASFPLLWASLGLENNLWMALGLGAVWCHLRGRAALAAILLMLGTLLRPEMAALVFVLAAESLAGGRPFRLLPAGIYAGGVGLGLLVILIGYPPGGFLPAPPAPGWDGLPALPPILLSLATDAVALFTGSILWAAPVLLALAGLSSLRQSRPLMILLGWPILHAISLIIIGGPGHGEAWVPAFCAAAGLGLGAAMRLLPGTYQKWLAAGAGLALAAVAVIQTTVRVEAMSHPLDADNRLRQAADWLAANTPSEALVATGDPAVIGYYLQRPVLDFHGSLQPDIHEAIQRGDARWWLMHYRPDYILLAGSDYQGADGLALADDEWFAASYAQTFRISDPQGLGEDLLIFQRTALALPMSELLIGFVSFPGGLTVNGIAADFSLFPLESTPMGLVRLEWLAGAPIDQPQVVSIRIQGRGGGAVAGLASQTIDFSTWPRNRLITTFHPIQIAGGLPPGVYDVEVGIGPDAFSQTWQVVAQAKVPFQSTDIVGGIAGARTEFGDIALVGYRLARSDQGLEVLLLWEAISQPVGDYRIVIQVRDLAGAVVAQTAVEPHNGIYPTSVWSAGEQVPDSYLLDISGLAPSDYEVYVGLLNADDSRILTLDGRDAAFIGRFNISQ